ncbi:LPS export ABC transporter permease LptG [Guyparkeria halophila]|uniref:LPS export ABC transporter permease LptG n=1 Tax=Guyparkeria halophila TaxID=47960 RepID=A0A6I6CU64_9GAMM|nr:LPS export ABC transporter permease LptG [Guyparkeria halophila]
MADSCFCGARCSGRRVAAGDDCAACGRDAVNTLDRYLIRSVVTGGLAASAAFGVLILVFGMIDEFSKIGPGYTTIQALQFVVLSTPGYLYELFPVTVLVGGLLSLGALAAHSELTVMRATGMSLLRLARPVLIAGVILAALGTTMGETIGAWGQAEANQMRAAATESEVSTDLASGFWLREGDRIVNVERALVDGQLLGLRVFELGADSRPQRVIEAGRAESLGDDRWRLEDVIDTRLPIDDPASAVRVERHAAIEQRLFDREILEIAALNPRYMNVAQLADYVGYLERNQLDASVYATAMWSRVVQPISVLAMLLVTLPFVFVAQRGGSAGRWLFIAILLGVAYMTLTQIVSALAPAYDISPILSTILPPTLFSIAGVVALYRATPRARRPAG